MTTSREARDAVRQMKAAGVDLIKVNFNEAAATDEAHRLGLRALCHWAANLAIQRVVEVGQDGVEHALLLAAYRPDAFAQFQRELAARKATLLAMDRVEIMARLSIWKTEPRLYDCTGGWQPRVYGSRRRSPSSVNWVWNSGRAISAAIRDGSTSFRQFWDSWNPQSGARRPVEPRRRELFAERVRRSDQATLAAYRAGVPMLAGSDCGANNSYMFCGWSFHEELEALVRAGLTPAEALRMATINAARLRGAAGSEGTVERGKVADLVLLRANPLSAIRQTREVEAVVRGGRYHLRNDLDAMLRKVQESAAAARQQRLQ